VSLAARIAGFAAVLALVFGAAALAGSRVDVRPGEDRDAPGAAPAMSGAMAADGDGHGAEGGRPAPQAVRGLAVSEGGLTLDLARTTARPGERSDLAFRIADRRGRTVRAFDVEHTKRMHLIVVRRELLQQALEGTGSILVPGGRAVAKHFWRDAPPARIGLLASERDRRFGETALTFYRRQEDR